MTTEDFHGYFLHAEKVTRHTRFSVESAHRDLYTPAFDNMVLSLVFLCAEKDKVNIIIRLMVIGQDEIGLFSHIPGKVNCNKIENVQRPAKQKDHCGHPVHLI